MDDLPPDQLFDDDSASELDSDEILDINEEDFDDIPLVIGMQADLLLKRRTQSTYTHFSMSEFSSLYSM